MIRGGWLVSGRVFWFRVFLDSVFTGYILFVGWFWFFLFDKDLFLFTIVYEVFGGDWY